MDVMKTSLPPIDKKRTLQLPMHFVNQFLKLAKAFFFRFSTIVGKLKYISGLDETRTPKKAPIQILVSSSMLSLK